MTPILVLFALAAVGGVTMLLMHLQGKKIPTGLAVGHGLLAAIALVLLILQVTGGGGGGKLTLALVLFVVAALGGFVLFAAQLKGKPLSTPLIFIHGGVAVVAFVLLLLTVL
jgi:hypothetical protein